MPSTEKFVMLPDWVPEEGEEEKEIKQEWRRERERARYMYTERTDIVFQIGIRGIGLLGSK